jgi:FKBP-type peptidyl-prolyl cis-trans isomerase SlpA
VSAARGPGGAKNRTLGRQGGTFYNKGSLQTLATRSVESFMPAVQSPVQAIVEPASFLTLHYRMAGLDGVDIINTFGSKPATLSLGTGELSPAIEQRLIGLTEGTRTTFELPAGEAFGERNPDLLQWVARKLLNELGDPDEQYKIGDVVQFPTPDGLSQYAGAVQKAGGKDDAVQFDFNHPLAGQPVVFEVELIGVL